VSVKTAATEAEARLMSKNCAMSASGDYPAVAAEVLPALGQVLVGAFDIGPGHRVLDVAAGSGNAAIPAALSGASVVATDLTPELFEAGRADASVGEPN
jgi:2-polyprenyl-3-methyl-5-hydroxy-6-metoxy-1,4-benzoquinol methylase